MGKRGRPNRSGVDWSDPAAVAAHKQQNNQEYHQSHKDRWRKRASDRRARLHAMRGGIRRAVRLAARLFWKRPHGEQHYRTALTDSDVRAIRRRYAAGESQVMLAAEFNLQKAAVSKIVNRKTWKHVDDEK